MKPWQKTLLILLAILLLLILVGPFLVPVPPLANTVPERDLADPDSRFIDVNGLTIHYKDMGAGNTTYILLHGFGASVFSWREVMDDFAAHGRVIAYDRPAFGLTSRPMPADWINGQNPYSIEANVAHLAALMDALQIDQAILVGNSAGGGTAVAFALAHPERVQALILVAPAVGGGGGRFPEWLNPLFATPQMRHIGPLLVRSIAETGNDTIRQAWHDPAKITPAVFEGYRKPLQAHNWDRALYEFSFAPRPTVSLRERLRELSMPVLVITGDDDRIVPTAASATLAQAFNFPLVILPTCGHVPQEECPQDFMTAVNQFIKPSR